MTALQQRDSGLLSFLVLISICFTSPGMAADTAAGEALYADHCAECHGEALRNPGSSFDLKELLANERPRFNASVLGGKGQMPPWKGVLSDADLDALWIYIRENAYH